MVVAKFYHFENLIIRLYVLYALNIMSILCQSDVIYYMIHKPIFLMHNFKIQKHII